ncbi:MAG: hypothetical protein ACREQX_16800 [Candidatus Binataceae bacterium]
MDKQHVKWMDKISGATVELIGSFNPSYSGKCFAAKISETGELRLFELVPKVSGLPLFSGRWDQKQNSVDIDLDISSISELNEDQQAEHRRDFKNYRRAYSGHHTCKIEYQRLYRVCVKAPIADFPNLGEPTIFDGEVRMIGLAFDGHVTAKIKVGATASAQVLDAEGRDVTDERARRDPNNERSR